MCEKEKKFHSCFVIAAAGPTSKDGHSVSPLMRHTLTFLHLQPWARLPLAITVRLSLFKHIRIFFFFLKAMKLDTSLMYYNTQYITVSWLYKNKDGAKSL